MTRDEYRVHIEKMLSEEAPINLKLMRECACSLGGSADEIVPEDASHQLIDAVELLDAALLHQVPDSVVDDIRYEARQALTLMFMVAPVDV